MKIVAIIIFVFLVLFVVWFAFYLLNKIIKDINREGIEKEKQLNEIRDNLFKP